MYKNINISSGSKSFQNKIFGRITKLTKPCFIYDGKIFSDNIFQNKKINTTLENNIYYANHGIPDEPIQYDLNYPINIDFDLLNNLSLFSILADQNNPVALRNTMALISSLSADPIEPNYDCQLNPNIP